MTAFARSDVTSITIPMEAGGCGEPHERDVENYKEWKKGKEAPVFAEGPFSVECAYCEPLLLEVHGWGRTPELAELTPDEVAQKERLEKEGSAATAIMASKLGEQLAQMVANTAQGQ